MLMKIRRKSDGKFSTGGGYPSWKGGGKTWNRLQDLASHYDLAVNGWGNRNRPNPYEDAEVVFFVVDESQTIPVRDLLDPELEGRKERAEKRRAENDLKFAQWQRDKNDERIAQLQKELERLQAETGIKLKGFS